MCLGLKRSRRQWTVSCPGEQTLCWQWGCQPPAAVELGVTSDEASCLPLWGLWAVHGSLEGRVLSKQKSRVFSNSDLDNCSSDQHFLLSYLNFSAHIYITKLGWVKGRKKLTLVIYSHLSSTQCFSSFPSPSSVQTHVWGILSDMAPLTNLRG